MHTIHQTDVADYIEKLGRPSYPQMVKSCFANLRIPEFSDDDQKQTR